MPPYKYRVYNCLSGHEYGDVDSYETANALRLALTFGTGFDPDDISVDLLVSARDNA